MIYRAPMTHRPRPDPDFDLAEEMALAADIERHERGRRNLAELSEMARRLAHSIEQYAKTRAEAAGAGDTAKPGFDPAASLAGLAKTIRLNDALAAKLAAAAEQTRLARSSREATRRRHARDLARKTGSGVTLH